MAKCGKVREGKDGQVEVHGHVGGRGGCRRWLCLERASGHLRSEEASARVAVVFEEQMNTSASECLES